MTTFTNVVVHAHERAVDDVAALLHERFCGCAASDADSGSVPWCDSIYPATSERAVLLYQQTMARLTR